MKLRRLLSVFGLAGFSFLSPGLHAQTFIWTGESIVNGDITDGDNWGGGIAPGGVSGTEDVVFGELSTGTQINVSIPTSTLRNITFDSDRPGYAFLSGGSAQVLTLTGDVTMQTGNSAFTFADLGISLTSGNHTVYIDEEAGGLSLAGPTTGAGGIIKTGGGMLTLTGTNTYTGGTTISDGTLELTSGSIAHASADFFVGDAGGDDGTLAISGGATVSSANGYIGHLTSSAGTVTIDGAGSNWTNATSLAVGNLGYGALTVSNGGKVTVAGGAGTLTLASGSSGDGYLTIGGSFGSPAAGGIINAATINAGAGTQALIDFYTDATAGSPYYLTRDGTSSGAPVAITGPVQVNISTGYNVLTGTGSNYTGGTILYGGTLADGNAGAFSPYSVIGMLGGSSLVVNFNETIGGLDDYDGSGPVSIASGATLTIDDSPGADAYFSGGFNGAGSVAKTGAGKLTLGGAGTYTGGTTITGGILVADHGNVSSIVDALGTGSVTINGGVLKIGDGLIFGNTLLIGSGGTLGGNATFSSPLTLGMGVTLSPGNSPGTMTFAAGLTPNDGLSTDIEINAAANSPGNNSDLIVTQGPGLNLGSLTTGGYTLRIISLSIAASNAQGPVDDLVGAGSWTIFQNSALTGFNAGLFTIDATDFQHVGTFALSLSGNDIVLNFTPVPEPSTYALMALGLMGTGYAAWRKRRQA